MAHEPVAVAGLERDKFVICEKPLTGYFGDGSTDFHWDRADKQAALDAALASVERMLAAERESKGRLLYAENWVYAPADPEGAGDPGEDRRADPLDPRRGGPQRLALGRLRLRGPLRRRRADRQGLPSADRRAVSEARRGPRPRRPADPPQDRLRPDPRHHPAARLPRRGPHPPRLLRHRRFLA